MDIEMLWFDNDPHTSLAEKVRRAAEYYQRKYGCAPTFCLVHPAMLRDAQESAIPLPVRLSHRIPRGHLWIGNKQGEKSRSAASARR